MAKKKKNKNKFSLKTFLIILSTLVIALSLAIGFSLLMFKVRLSDSVTFTNSGAKSGIYREIRFELEKEFIKTTLGQEYLENSIAKHIVSEIDFSEIIVSTGKTWIEDTIKYINLEKDTVNFALPISSTNAKISQIIQTGINEELLKELFIDLPKCETDYVVSADEFIPQCVFEDTAVDYNYYQKQIQNYLEQIVSENKIKEVFNNYLELNQTNDFYNISSISDYQNNLFENLILNTRRLNFGINYLFIGILIFAISFSLFISLLAKFSLKQNLLLLGSILLISGAITFLAGIVGSNSGNVVFNSIIPDINGIQTSLSLIIAFKEFLILTQYSIFEMVLFIGLSLLSIGSLISITSIVLQKPKS